MKKTLLFLMLATFLFSCNDTKTKSETTEEEETVSESASSDGTLTYQGEFIYTPEASVFKGGSFVYGVEINDVARDLAKRVEAVKTGDFDMVPVIVRGKVTKKPEGTEGWDEIITITKIINVSETPTKADIELKVN